MADPWAAFPDAPQEGLVINMTKKPAAGADPWDSFPDAAPSGTGRTAARLIGQVAQNANDAIAGTLGAPVDLLAAGARKLGIPADRPVGGSESLKSGIDYVATLPGRISDAVSQRSLDPLTESRTSRFEPETRGEKIAAGVGQGVGMVASTIMPAAAVARAATPGTVTQRAADMLASQPAVQTASGAVGGAVTGATDNPYLGLAAGVATPLAVAGGRGVISPVTNRLTDNERSLVAAAKREGIPLTPAQETGSRVLRGLEETMTRIPGSAGTMRRPFDEQRGAFNKAVMSRTGTDAADASPSTLSVVDRNLSEKFDELAARTTLAPDAQFAKDILKTATDYGRRLETDVAPVFKSYMDDLGPVLDRMAKGEKVEISGEVYKTVRSDLTTRMRSTSNLQLKRALGGLVEALDGVVDRTASPALLKEWQDVRRQYAAYKTVDKAMSGGTQADRAAADIPLGAFSNAVKAGDKTGYARARGQYGELAKIADMLAPQIPNSGTPERLMWANLLTGGALGAGAGATTGSLLTGAGTAAAATLSPYIAAKLYNSGPVRRYLTNEAAGSTDLKSLYGAQAAQSSPDLIPGHERDNRAVARALLRQNEKRRAAAQ